MGLKIEQTFDCDDPLGHPNRPLIERLIRSIVASWRPWPCCHKTLRR